jgi:hypothetical protein
MSAGEEHQRQVLNASVRTILLSTITDHILTQLVTRSHQKSATDSDYFCESFRYDKSVDSAGQAQMERLLQFGRILSRSM